MPPSTKIFVVSKYIPATSLSQALKLERSHPPDSIELSNEWFNKIGFIPNATEGKDIKGFESKKE